MWVPEIPTSFSGNSDQVRLLFGVIFHTVVKVHKRAADRQSIEPQERPRSRAVDDRLGEVHRREARDHAFRGFVRGEDHRPLRTRGEARQPERCGQLVD